VEDVNVRHFLAINGKSPLHYAVKGGCLRCVRLLVEAGARLDITDIAGLAPESALTSGIDSGRTDVVKWLLAQGASLTARTTRDAIPLHFAVSGSPKSDSDAAALECTRMLLEAGSAIDARDDYGSTPLHYAACSGNVQTMRCLIAAGATYKTQTSAASNWTALQELAAFGACAANGTDTSKARVKQIVEVARVLMELGVDPHARMAPSSDARLKIDEGGNASALELTSVGPLQAADGTMHLAPGQLEIAALIEELDASRPWLHHHHRQLQAITAAPEAAPEAAASQTSACAACGNTSGTSGAALKKCARCLCAQYCSVACQRTHWPVHKRCCVAAAPAPPLPTATATDPALQLSKVSLN